jgi:hypothetical protein
MEKRRSIKNNFFMPDVGWMIISFVTKIVKPEKG